VVLLDQERTRESKKEPTESKGENTTDSTDTADRTIKFTKRIRGVMIMYQIDEVEISTNNRANCSYGLCERIQKGDKRGITYTTFCGHSAKRFFCQKHTEELLRIHRKHLNKLVRKLKRLKGVSV